MAVGATAAAADDDEDDDSGVGTRIVKTGQRVSRNLLELHPSEGHD